MSFSYFNRLNYTLANEDTAMELKMMPEGAGHLFSVAGSGGRVLPLLANKPKKVTCVDLASEQLYLTELRMESCKKLSHGDFLAFWGYPPRSASPDERKALFHELELSAPAKKFFKGLFDEKEWSSILYDGKWERTFAKLARINQKFTGVRGANLFSALNDTEHESYLKNNFPNRAWEAVLFLLGNASVFNALLYKGHFPKKNIPGSLFNFYKKVFSRLFEMGPARQSWFLQIVFFGKILYEEGNPIECDPVVFEKAKEALKTAEIIYRKGNAVELASKSDTPIDFLSFSDVPSYFSGRTEKNFLKDVSKGLNSGAQVVVRNYLRVPENLNTQGFEKINDEHVDAIRDEKVQVYLVDAFRWVH